MYRAISPIFIILCLPFLGAASHAGELAEPFVGITDGQMSHSEQGHHVNLRGAAVTGDTSVGIARWLGARVRKASYNDDEDVMGLNIRGPRFASALARVGLLPVEGRPFGVYGLAGYTTDEVRASVLDVNGNEIDPGPSFGAGVELLASDRSGLSIEFTRHVDGVLDDGMEFKIEHIGVGYEMRF